MILLANNISVWMIFAYLPFMIAFFFPRLSTTELGFKAGILGSAFSAGGLIGNFVSGLIADKWGRRPALLCGLTGTAISSLCFGFSPSFWFAVLSRFTWGVLNGNIGVAKTYLSEISDDSNVAKGMAYFSVIGSVGRVIGPMIGGLLSYPARSYPSVFAGTIFDTFPFALPSVIVTINCVAIIAVTYVWLPETLPAHLLSATAGAGAAQFSQSSSISSGDASKSSTPNGSHLRGSGETERSGVKYQLVQTVEDEDEQQQDGNRSAANGDNTFGNGRKKASVNGGRASHGGHEHEAKLEMVQMGRNSASFLPEKRNMQSMSRNISHSESEMEGGEAQRFLPITASSRTSTGVTDKEDQDSEVNDPLGETIMDKTTRSVKQKRRLTFSSVVKVKDMHTQSVSYKSLKALQPNEQPVALPGVLSANIYRNIKNPTAPVGKNLESNDSNGNNGDTLWPNGIGSARDNDEALEPTVTNPMGESDGGDLSDLPLLQYTNGAEEFLESIERVKNQSWFSNLFYLMRQRHIFITTSLYGLSSFLTTIANMIFSLWIVTSHSDGGLHYNTQQIGIATMIAGVFTTVFQLTVYPYVVERLGALQVYRWGAVGFSVSCLFVPALGPLTAGSGVNMTLFMVCVVLCAQLVTVNWYLVSTFLLISNSCYSHQLSSVNSIGQTCASIGRLAGPYLGSVLFAWSETNGLQWPFDQYLVFYLLAALGMGTYQYSRYLPRSIHRRKREPKFQNWDDAAAAQEAMDEPEGLEGLEGPGRREGQYNGTSRIEADAAADKVMSRQTPPLREASKL
jgi:MFS family permease